MTKITQIEAAQEAVKFAYYRMKHIDFVYIFGLSALEVDEDILKNGLQAAINSMEVAFPFLRNNR